MAQVDLSKLSLNKGAPASAQLAARRRRKWIKWGVIGVLFVGAAAALIVRRANAPIEVELGTVTTAYPTQGFTLLNATGRVVAARKAAVSTKATGRLEFLGVQEGSVVKAGQVLARLEALDVNATRDQARAGTNAAQANLLQGGTELTEAEANYRRTQDLFQKNFVSAASLDTAKARLDRARATIASLKAAISVAEAQTRSASVSVEQTVIRAPFDERRRHHHAVFFGCRIDRRSGDDGGHEHAGSGGRRRRIEHREGDRRRTVRDHAGRVSGGPPAR